MKSWFSMKAESGVAEISIYDEIGFWGVTSKQFKAELDALGEEIGEIILHINSPGGDMIEGNAIYNALVEHKAKKTVVIDGWAASMASVVAMAGDVIKMHENAFLMIHNPFVMTVGDSDQLRKDADVLDKLKANAIKAYRRHAKDLTDEDISKLMDEDTWLTAEDAKVYGLADEILTPAAPQAKMLKTGSLKNIPSNVVMALMGIRPEIKNGGAGQSRANDPDPATHLNGGLMNPKCLSCSKEITAGAAFCPHCGKPQDQKVAHNREMDEARAEAANAERSRVNDIVAMCMKHGVNEADRTAYINGKQSAPEVAVAILNKIETSPVVPSAAVTADESDKFRDLAGKSLQVMSGIEKNAAVVADIRKNEAPRNLHGLVLACAQRSGLITQRQMTAAVPHDIAEIAFRMAAAGTGDLTAVLANVANKALGLGFEEAPTTFQQWTGEGEVKDFKSMTIAKLSNFSDIDDIPEGMAFNSGKFSDKKETVSIDTKGKAFSLTRQAIINDDLNAFVKIPRAMMSSVKRRINKDVYDKLCYNSLVGPVMTETGLALFHTTHGNLKTSTGTPSVTTISAAEVTMMGLKFPAPDKKSASQPTNFTGRYVISGTANRLRILQVLGTNFDLTATLAGVVNPYGGMVPVIDAYLQSLLTAASAANSWYLATDQNMCETISVYYLAGNRVPTLRNEPSRVGDALGISWDIYMDWGIAVPDWRGLVYNDGK